MSEQEDKKFKSGVSFGILLTSMMMLCRAMQKCDEKTLDEVKEIAADTEKALDAFVKEFS